MSCNTEWINDAKLESDLKSYVAQNYKRTEILDFVKRDFAEYQWSIATLARRLKQFQISYVDYTTDVDKVQEAVQTELDGPGKLLGYRAMNLKLRTEHGIQVPRHLVHNVMKELDPDGLEDRSLKKKAKRRKKPFVSDGPLWLLSLDGHDKLCGYQNWTFPLGVYGCMDTFSRKIVFLLVFFSNSDPNVIGKRYLKYLFKIKMLPNALRVDRGTETGKLTTIQAHLADKLEIFEDPMNSVVFGPSTSNKIERWWRDLHERLEKYFKSQLQTLLNSREYDPHNREQREVLAYVYIPILQRECDIFVTQWNSHRIRAQEKLLLPTGIPNHMFEFPETYGGRNKGTAISEELLQEIATVSGVLKADLDDLQYMDAALKRECQHHLPDPAVIISSNEAIEAYRFLKHKVL